MRQYDDPLAQAEHKLQELEDLGWWWVREGNPQCFSWCTEEHAPHEFRAMGTIGCTRTIADREAFTVTVTGAQMAAEEQPAALTRAVDVMVTTNTGIPASEIEELCDALRLAASVCQGSKR